MQLANTIAFTTFLLVLTSCQPTLAQDLSASELLSRWVDWTQQCEKAKNNIEITVAFDGPLWSDGERLDTIYGKHGHMYVESTFQSNGSAQGVNGYEPGEIYTKLLNPVYSATLVGTAPNFFLRKVAKNELGDSPLELPLFAYIAPPGTTDFSAMETYQASEKSRTNTEVVCNITRKAHATVGAANTIQNEELLEFEVTFSSEANWLPTLIKETKVDFGPGVSQRARSLETFVFSDFQSVQGGNFLFPTKMSYSIASVAEPQKSSPFYGFQVRQFAVGASQFDTDRCYLSYYGMKEPDYFYTSTKYVWWGVGVVALGLVLLGIGYSFKKRQS